MLPSEMELGERVSSVLKKGGFSEIVDTLDVLEEFMQNLSNGGGGRSKVKAKLWNNEALLRFQLLKVVQDKVSDKDGKVTGDMVSLSISNFDKMILLPNKLGVGLDKKKTSELYARLSYFACQLGFRFQKKKMFEEALMWCDRATKSYEKWMNMGAEEVEVKMNRQWLAFLKTECLRSVGKPVEGLKWLATELSSDPSYWRQPSLCYDLFDQIPWTDCSTHWMAMWKDVWVMNPEFNKCTLDFLEEDILVQQDVMSKVLRLELNAHFATRHAIPVALLRIGEVLLERSTCHFDNVLGYLSIAVASFFGSATEIDYAVEIIHEAVEFVESNEFFKRERNADSTAFITGLLSIWRGLCVLKSHQYFAEAELSYLKEQISAENPDKFRDRDTGEEIRGASGLCQLTLDHERDWVCSLTHGVEIFLRFSESESIFKNFCNEFCPSLVLITCRLASTLLVAIGDLVAGAKAWHIVNKLARIYDKKGLIVLSASEILKIVPDIDCEFVEVAEKANQTANEENLIRHNKAMGHRLSLAKAVACYNLKEFSVGVKNLMNVFNYLATKDNFDAAHHLMGESIYVLSLYRTIQYSHDIDLTGLPESLIKMSPAGLVTKAFKVLGGMTRQPDLINSGWTDILHNYYLLSTLFGVGTHSMRILRESGKTREMKCFVNDLINFAQHCGFVSRTISLIVPLINIDISCRNFMHAQLKIDAVNSLYSNSVCQEEPEHTDSETYEQLIKNLKLPLSLKRLECMNDLQWLLRTLDIPSLHYRHRSEKYVGATKRSLREGFSNTTFKFYDWMRHSLSCCCYVCCHPHILTDAYEFLHTQAKYLNCMCKAKSAMAVLENSKLCHERTVFRLICNISLLTVPLSAICSKKGAAKAIENIYTPFCIAPALDALMTQMTVCPVVDIKMILSAMKKAKMIIETLDPKDYIGKSFPLELGYAALYSHFTTTGQVVIKGTEIRGLLDRKLKVQNKENKAASPVLKKIANHAQLPPRKGILKNSKEEIVDDRPIPHIPILNFEQCEDSLSSCSSDTQSANLKSSTDPRQKTNNKNPAQPTKLQRSQKTATATTNNVTERRPRRTAK